MCHQAIVNVFQRDVLRIDRLEIATLSARISCSLYEVLLLAAHRLFAPPLKNRIAVQIDVALERKIHLPKLVGRRQFE